MEMVAARCERTMLSQAGPGAGERALMRAVLEDAIRCLSGQIGAARERAQLAVEARAWVDASDARWPFSFENVCDALHLSSDQLRGRLLRSAGPPTAADAARSPTPRVRRPVSSEGDIVRMISDGCPLRVVAATFGISVSKASILSRGLASRLKAERDREILRLRGAGWTHRAIAAHFRLSRIRVMRICARRDEVAAA